MNFHYSKFENNYQIESETGECILFLEDASQVEGDVYININISEKYNSVYINSSSSVDDIVSNMERIGICVAGDSALGSTLYINLIIYFCAFNI